MSEYHNPYSNYAFNITYIRDKDEVELVSYLINRMIQKRDDPENKTLSQHNYNCIIDSYNREIQWLNEKINEYNSRKNIRNHL